MPRKMKVLREFLYGSIQPVGFLFIVDYHPESLDGFIEIVSAGAVLDHSLESLAAVYHCSFPITTPEAGLSFIEPLESACQSWDISNLG